MPSFTSTHRFWKPMRISSEFYQRKKLAFILIYNDLFYFAYISYKQLLSFYYILYNIIFISHLIILINILLFRDTFGLICFSKVSLQLFGVAWMANMLCGPIVCAHGAAVIWKERHYRIIVHQKIFHICIYS